MKRAISARPRSICCSVILCNIGPILALSVHVRDEEDDSEHEAESTNDDVAYREEVILSSKEIGCWNDEVLVASETADIVVVLDFDPVPSCLQILIDHSVKLAEVWETSRSHPDNEVFY